jgi:hypothetical protein
MIEPPAGFPINPDTQRPRMRHARAQSLPF